MTDDATSMHALNAVALALWLAQVLAYTYKSWRARELHVQEGRAYQSKNSFTPMKLYLIFQLAVASGLCLLCVLGAAGTLPYQQQRGSVGTHTRNAEFAFGVIFGLIGAVCWFGAWTSSTEYEY